MNIQVFDAIDYAIRMHDGQARKGGNGPPYVVHCIDVLKRVVQTGMEERSVLCAAVLHDTIEDTAATYMDIEDLFGRYTADMVQELTLPEGVQRDFKKKLQHQVTAMETTLHDPVRLIKIADKTSNILDLIIAPPKWGKKAMAGYVQDSMLVVAAARASANSDAVRELAEAFFEHAAIVSGNLEAR